MLEIVDAANPVVPQKMLANNIAEMAAPVRGVGLFDWRAGVVMSRG